MLTLFVIRRVRDLDRYRYLLLGFGVGLLLLPLVPHLGANINGARLWIHVGTFTFQPVELAKILLCIFFASYFAEKRELLTIPTARLGNRLVLDPRPLVPILLAWGFAIVVMSLEHDIGFSALLFTLFIGHALADHRADRVPGPRTASCSASAPTWPATYFSQTHIRVEIWLDPWKPCSHGDPGLQLRPGVVRDGQRGHRRARASGSASAPTSSPTCRPTSSSPPSARRWDCSARPWSWSPSCCWSVPGLRIAQTARSEFAKLAATGLTIILGFQAFFIMAGVVRLLPLTGITLPFVSYGGSSLVANYVLIALLMRISDEGTAAADAAEQSAFEDEQERRHRLLTGR